MIFKPYPIFSRAMIVSSMEPGETKETNLGGDGLVLSGYYFVTKGCIKTTVKETGKSLGDRSAGWLNTEQTSPVNSEFAANGILQITCDEPTEWVCVSHIHNARLGLPELKSFIVDLEGTKEFENNSNLFLVRGQLKIKSKTFIGPCSIRIRSGDIIATNVSDEKCYGLIVIGS